VFLNTENISAFVGFSWKIEIEMHGATMKIILRKIMHQVGSIYEIIQGCTVNKIYKKKGREVD
jgi:hypothetical protein